MFIHRLLAFWTLKRQSRNGVPLLRRLTTSYPRRNANYNNNNIHSPSPTKKSPQLLKKRKSLNTPSLISSAPEGGKVFNRERTHGEKVIHRDIGLLHEELVTHRELVNRGEDLMVQGEKVDVEEKCSEEIQYWQRLRQDLERARLLCELIRKREKMKRDLVKAQAEERLVQLAPFVHLLLQKIDQLQEKDVQQIFAEPVDFEEVPDYLDVVKHPMDLSTMRQKAQAHQYQNVDQFAADFELMIENCLTYNSRDTIFFRAGVKLRDQGGSIIRQLVRDVDTIGFDLETGLMLPHRPKPPPNFSEDDILEEIDKVLNNESEGDENFETRKVKLLHLLDQANLIKHYMTRIKTIKLLRREIGNVRRKLTCSESGLSTSYTKSNFHDSDISDKEESDKDDSSVIDDEAEPGVPSRPSSPQVVPATILPVPPTVLPVNPSILPEPPLPMIETEEPVPCLIPNRRLSTEQATQVTPFLGKSRKNLLKVDSKQRKIDAFFTKISKPVSLEDSKENQGDIEKDIEEKSEITKKGTETVTPAPPAPRKRGRPPKHSLSAIGMSGSSEVKHPNAYAAKETCKKLTSENSKTCHEEYRAKDYPISSGSTSPVLNRKSSLFTKKPHLLFKKPANEDSTPEVDGGSNISLLNLPQSSTLTKESFKIYRQGGENSHETDDDTQSESNSSMSDSEDESQSDSGSDEGGSDTDSSTGADDHSNGGLSGTAGEQIPLEPLDLVWAKCRGYPWYPALIINPKMPRTGYFHNHVPIPVPPEDVLAHANNYHIPMYLVLFFDQKRTWQWLPRNKLEPLGVNSALDKAKLVESRKPADRKAVKRAYEKAILHRCRVTGENTGLSGESDNDSQP